MAWLTATPSIRGLEPGNRGFRLVFLGVAGALGGIVLFVLFEQFVAMLRTDRRWAVTWSARVAALGGLAIFAALGIVGFVPRRLRSGLDSVATLVINGPVTAAVVAACLLLVATWVPDYLTWPWFADADQFAVSALAWDAGLAPY